MYVKFTLAVADDGHKHTSLLIKIRPLTDVIGAATYNGS